MNNETKTREQTLNEKITQLEGELETKRAEFKETHTKEALGKVNATLSEISDYKRRLKIELELRGNAWKDFKASLTPEEFSELWEGRLARETVANRLQELEDLDRKLNAFPWRGI